MKTLKGRLPHIVNLTATDAGLTTPAGSWGIGTQGVGEHWSPSAQLCLPGTAITQLHHRYCGVQWQRAQGPVPRPPGLVEGYRTTDTVAAPVCCQHSADRSAGI